MVLIKSLRNPRRVGIYRENVILKVNSKMDGQNALVNPFERPSLRHISCVPFLNTPHVIVVANVMHRIPGGCMHSVAALGGSRDREGIHYSASIRNQARRQNVIEGLGVAKLVMDRV